MKCKLIREVKIKFSLKCPQIQIQRNHSEGKNVVKFAKSKIFLVIFYGDCQSSQGSDTDYGRSRSTFLNLEEMLFGIKSGLAI